MIVMEARGGFPVVHATNASVTYHGKGVLTEVSDTLNFIVRLSDDFIFSIVGSSQVVPVRKCTGSETEELSF